MMIMIMIININIITTIVIILSMTHQGKSGGITREVILGQPPPNAHMTSAVRRLVLLRYVRRCRSRQ
jgi:hypothetical protein